MSPHAQQPNDERAQALRTDATASDSAAAVKALGTADRKQSRRALIGSFVGTSLEWYDFFLFGTTAAIVFAPLFFGGDDPALRTIQSLLTFAVGFLGRPLGAVVFGHFGDRLGRKGILIVTIVLMGTASALIGLLPTYETAGIVAPLLLAILRFVQGVATGGEWGGAMLMAVESAPAHKRGLYGAIVQIGSPMGTLMSSGAVAGAIALSGPAFLEWGWRIPYLASIVLVILGVLLRLTLQETADYQVAQTQKEPTTKKKAPIIEVLTQVPGRLIVAVCTYLFGNAGFFLLTTFMIGYVTNTLRLEPTVILNAISIGAVSQIVSMYIAGRCADRFSPSSVIIVGYAIAVVSAFPIFWLVGTRDAVLITLAMVVGIGLSSIPYAPLGTLLTQLFPVHIRYTEMAVAANTAGIVAGFVPALAAWLLTISGDSYVGPAVLLLAIAITSLLGAIVARRIIVADRRRSPVAQA